MLLHVMAACVDSAEMLHCQAGLQALTLALDSFISACQPCFLAISSGSPLQDQMAALPAVQLTLGCSAFHRWCAVQRHAHGGCRLDASGTRQASALLPAALAGCSSECARLAEVAAAAEGRAAVAPGAADWHRHAHSLMQAAQGASSNKAASVQVPEPSAIALVQASEPAQSDSMDSDDLDEVVLEPGHGWAGNQAPHVEDTCRTPRSGNMPAPASGVDTVHAMPLTEHASLATQLDLPASMNLGLGSVQLHPVHHERQSKRNMAT